MVSRPADRTPLESPKRRYRDSAGVPISVGEEIFLPDEQYCHWCKEERFLRSIADLLPTDSQEARASIGMRIEQLVARPLSVPIFMHDPAPIDRDDLQAIDSF